MTVREFLQWGAEHHHPQLVLSSDPADVLRAGKSAWHALVEGDDPERLRRTVERTRQWEERMSKTRK